MNERIWYAIEQVKGLTMYDAARLEAAKAALMATVMTVRATCKHPHVHYHGLLHVCEDCRLAEWQTNGDKKHEMPKERINRNRTFHLVPSSTALHRYRIELMLEKNTLRNLVL